MKKFFLILSICLCFFITKAQVTDSLKIKIGQMIMIGIAKAEIDPVVLEEVKQGKAGTILLFEKNIPKTNSYAGLKKILYTYQQSAPIPLFISIDQEGGRVNRLKEKYGFPRSISAAQMGKAKSLDSVRYYGASTASTLAGLGFNINFAPVVDVAVNPENPIIAKVERSFSANEDSVALMASAFIEEHRKVGVLTALKHFPGHGSSKDDTHLGMADVTDTWSERELKPYSTMIASGLVDAIMTSHIVNKKLDQSGLPGTLSKDVLDGILRKKLGYNGVVISDDMQMLAITKNYGFEEAIKLAINAGVDILCFSNNIAGSEARTVDKVHEIIRRYVERGEIPVQRINESFTRVIKLKKSMDYHTRANELAETQREVSALREKVALLEASQTEDLIIPVNDVKNPVSEEPEKSKKKKKNRKNRS